MPALSSPTQAASSGRLQLLQGSSSPPPPPPPQARDSDLTTADRETTHGPAPPCRVEERQQWMAFQLFKKFMASFATFGQHAAADNDDAVGEESSGAVVGGACPSYPGGGGCAEAGESASSLRAGRLDGGDGQGVDASGAAATYGPDRRLASSGSGSPGLERRLAPLRDGAFAVPASLSADQGGPAPQEPFSAAFCRSPEFSPVSPSCELCANSQPCQLCATSQSREICGNSQSHEFCANSEFRELSADSQSREFCANSLPHEFCRDTQSRELCATSQSHEFCATSPFHELCANSQTHEFCAASQSRDLCGNSQISGFRATLQTDGQQDPQPAPSASRQHVPAGLQSSAGGGQARGHHPGATPPGWRAVPRHHALSGRSSPSDARARQAEDPAETAPCAACHNARTHKHGEGPPRLGVRQGAAGRPSGPEVRSRADGSSSGNVDRSCSAHPNDGHGLADDEDISADGGVSSPTGDRDASGHKAGSGVDDLGDLCTCTVVEPCARSCAADRWRISPTRVAARRNTEAVARTADRATALPGGLSRCEERSCEGGPAAQERSDRQQSTSLWSSSRTDQLPVRERTASASAWTSEHCGQNSEFRVPFPKRSLSRLAWSTQQADGGSRRTPDHVSGMSGSSPSPSSHVPVRKGLRRAPARTPTSQQSRLGPFSNAASRSFSSAPQQSRLGPFSNAATQSPSSTPKQSRLGPYTNAATRSPSATPQQSRPGPFSNAAEEPLSRAEFTASAPASRAASPGEGPTPRGLRHRPPSGTERIHPPTSATRCASSAWTPRGATSTVPPSPAASEFDCGLLKAAASSQELGLPLSAPGTAGGRHARQTAGHASGPGLSAKPGLSRFRGKSPTGWPAEQSESALQPTSSPCEVLGSRSPRRLPGDSGGDDEMVPNSEVSDDDTDDDVHEGCLQVTLSSVGNDRGWTNSEDGSVSETSSCLSGDLCVCVCGGGGGGVCGCACECVLCLCVSECVVCLCVCMCVCVCMYVYVRACMRVCVCVLVRMCLVASVCFSE